MSTFRYLRFVVDLLIEVFMFWTRYQQKIVWIIILLTAGIIVVNGITTEVSLGDESHHYRFAQNIYTEGKRVPFDPLYESGNPPGFFNNDPPLWHLILAFLWKVTGGISQVTAQIYHALFFVLLGWVTFLLAKETVGEKERWFPAFVVATVPMVVSFSTLFYTDVPVTAFTTLSFYLILKKRYIEAGLASGLAYFTKFNSVFFFPGFLFLIIWSDRKRFWNLVRNVAFFIFPILIIYISDSHWRRLNIIGEMDTIGLQYILFRFSLAFSGGRWREYLNSYLTNPFDLVKYLGLGFLLLMVFHLFRIRRWDRKDSVFWVPVLSYFFFFLIVFGIETDIRYLLPILPFMIVLFTPSFLSFGRVWHFIMIALCILQFVGTNYYVHQKRVIPSEVKEGFEYIRKNLPRRALILYPEENLLIYGQRRMIWNAVQSYRTGEKGLYLLLLGSNEKEMGDLLKANNIDHILIKKSRIFDDQREHHTGGYSQSFVGELSNLEGWVKIFENQGVELWKKVE